MTDDHTELDGYQATTGNYRAIFLPPNPAYEFAMLLDQIERLHENISDLAELKHSQEGK